MSPWTDLRPATCLPAHCFCEGDLGGWIRQPWGTVSNLGFVLVGLWLMLRARAYGYGALVVFLGIGSGIYHASLTFVGQWIDNISMYLVPTYFALKNLKALRLDTYLAVNAAVAAGAWFWPDGRRIFFGALIAALLVTEVIVRARRDRRLLAAAVLTFAASFAFWILDMRGIVCPGHGIWHLGGALTAGLLYFYYDSEKLPAAGTPATITG